MHAWRFLGWYYLRDGVRVGPVSNAEVARLLDAGQLQPLDEVWKAWQDGDAVRFFQSQARVAVGGSSVRRGV